MEGPHAAGGRERNSGKDGKRSWSSAGQDIYMILMHFAIGSIHLFGEALA